MIILGGIELKVSGVVDTDPADLFAAPPEQGWLIAHCKPRQEKLFCAELTWRGIPRGIFYERRVRRYPGKGTHESLVPLIGGYVFCVGNYAERDLIYRTGRVVRLLAVPRQVELAQQLNLLAALVARSSGPLVVKPEIVPGTLVTLTRGTFSGCTGIVVRRKGTCQLVVNLSVLGTSVGVELPAETAESLDG
jgi:transcription antitermination factor NusG